MSGDGDCSAPTQSQVRYLETPSLVAWFAQNVAMAHPKLFPLPIGVYYSGQKPSMVADKVRKLVQSRCTVAPTLDVFAAWQSSTNPLVRKPLWNTVLGWPPSQVTVLDAKVDLKEFFGSLLPNHRMVLSPRGNGVDCFRTWETLYSGRVPVVVSSHLDPLFAQLPVIILPSWDNVTLPELQARYAVVMAGFSQPGRYSPRHLELDYHVCRIKHAAGRAVGAAANDCGGGVVIPDTVKLPFVTIEELARTDPSQRALAPGCPKQRTELCKLEHVFDEIFVLGAESRVRFAKRISAQLGALGTPFTLIRAQPKDAPGIKEQAMRYMDNSRFHSNRNAGVYALHLTQLAVFDYIARSPGKRFLIFEDDVILHRSFPAAFNTRYRKIPSNWWVLFLGAETPLHHWRPWLWKPDEFRKAGYYTVPAKGRVWGSWALGFTKSAAARLAESMRYRRTAIDQMTYEDMFMEAHGTAFMMWPNVAAHFYEASDLGHQRDPALLKKQRKDNEWWAKHFDSVNGYTGGGGGAPVVPMGEKGDGVKV